MRPQSGFALPKTSVSQTLVLLLTVGCFRHFPSTVPQMHLWTRDRHLCDGLSHRHRWTCARHLCGNKISDAPRHRHDLTG